MDQNEVINNSINSDLIRGHIDTIILKALQAGDRYGYDIIKEIEHKSDGQYVIKQPTLYSCLKRLEVQGFVKSYWGSKSIGGRKKYFTLTDLGRELFIKNITDWNYSRDVINKLISDDDYSSASYNDVSAEDAEDNFNDSIEQTQEESEIITSVSEEVEDFEAVEQEEFDDIENCENDCHEDDIEEFDEEESDCNVIEEDFDEQVAITSDKNEQLNNESIDDCDVNDESTYIEEQVKETTCVQDDLSDSTTLAESNQSDEEEILESTNTTSVATNFDDAIPLSDSELTYSLDEFHFSTDDQSENINEFYDNSSRESYIDNVKTAKYSADDDVIDVGNYFTDFDIVDEEEVASAVSTEAFEQVAQEDAPTPKIFPSRKIIRSFDKKEETVFYSYNRPMSNIDESSAVIDNEYRGIIAKLINDNIVRSKPENEPTSNPIENVQEEAHQITYEQKQPNNSQIKDKNEQKQIESETGEKFDVRTHSHDTIKLYNSKHYYYNNQLKLMQSGILFGIMLVEIVLCFYFIEILHNNLVVSNFNLGMYIAAVALAATFPISAFFAASSNYYKRKRINYSGKSNALFSIATTILLILIIFFINIYAGLLIGDINNYLSKLILPATLSTNVIVNAIVFHILYKSGKYSLDN